MKATIVKASPRGERGASSRMATQLAKGLERAGVDVEEIILNDHRIEHCIGCYSCWMKTPGRCIHRDDMDRLLPKMQTDLLVFATPLYIFSVPGLAKDFLDRQLPLLEPFLVERDGTTGHPRRDGSTNPKLFLMSAAGFPERSHFDALVAMMKKTGSPYLGDILVGGAEPMSRNDLQGAYAELYTLIEQAGFELGQHEAMSAETEQAILEKTSFSENTIKAFQRTANNYWKAQLSETRAPEAPKDRQNTHAKELSLSDGGMATFLAGMALQYNPEAAPDLSAVLQFSFEDEVFHLSIAEKRCKAYRGEHPEPDMTVISPKQVWLDISEGTLDSTKALMDGMYSTEGDMGLLMKFDRLFGLVDEEGAAGRDGSPEGRDRLAKDDDIPEHRGPLNIPVMGWMTVAFAPWMILWMWGGIAPGPLPRYAAAVASVLLALYHLSTNVITLFEAGSSVYLLAASAVTVLGWKFFAEFGPVLDYLFLGGLWFASLTRRFSLTAEYSRYLFPKVIWSQASFRETNGIISAAWGGYFLLAACLNLIAITGYGSRLVLTIMTYCLLAGMFVFTSKFQQWYPEKLLRAQRKA